MVIHSVLFDVDVEGKVVHLVQRPPPGSEPRSSSTPRLTPRSGRQFHLNPNATFNGPAEDGETLPFHHEMRRIMVSNGCSVRLKSHGTISTPAPSGTATVIINVIRRAYESPDDSTSME